MLLVVRRQGFQMSASRTHIGYRVVRENPKTSDREYLWWGLRDSYEWEAMPMEVWGTNARADAVAQAKLKGGRVVKVFLRVPPHKVKRQ
jgi:hypothetical protein